jgi:hypothetical protein
MQKRKMEISISETDNDGVIYQLSAYFEPVGPVLVHIEYTTVNDVIRYESATVEPGDNPGLTPSELYQVNLFLDAEYEYGIQEFLAQAYDSTSIHYQSNLN